MKLYFMLKKEYTRRFSLKYEQTHEYITKSYRSQLQTNLNFNTYLFATSLS